METFQHLVGACGDNHTHLDLTDIVFIGGGGATAIYVIKHYALTAYFLIKGYIKW